MTPVVRTAPAATAGAPQLEGAKHRSVETARNRLLAAGIIFAFVFLVMAGRLVGLTVFDGASSRSFVDAEAATDKASRGDIVDRNGVLLATSLPAASVYADPQQILDADAAVADLARVLTDIDREALRARLTSPSRFVWVQRGLTPEQHQAVNALGIPGLDFVWERRRVYPHGRAVAHVVGATDIDGHGIAGVEQTFEDSLAEGHKLDLGLDIRVQHILRRELEASRREFSALGAAGLVLDIGSGDVIGMVSLPDFDPNHQVTDADDEARFNRVTKGVYEMGSTMKLFTVAMALDSGSTTLSGGYDATRPLNVARFTISDYHPKKRWLSTPEVLVYSSNIGCALMALDVGTTLQQQYLRRFGLLEAARIEVPEVGAPLVPNPWREINTMTVGFGHGLAITPLQLANGVSALVNGGVLRPASLRHRDGGPAPGTRVLSSKTSKQMRELMRQVVLHGTGAKADVPGYKVGGKTGTAEKLVRGHYIENARISSFVGAFPIDAPRYVVLAMLDEPKGNRSTANYATGGWVAAPVVARLVRHMAPLLGIPPVPDGELPDEIRKASTGASQKVGQNATPQRQRSAMVAAKQGSREKHLASN